MDISRVRTLVDEVLPEVERIRHDIHQHPELAMQEGRTAGLVRERLARAGARVLPALMETDVIALLEGPRPGPNVTLRADMDALPIRERNDLPYRSGAEGVMHACGHDGHTAMLLGAAVVLARLRDELAGSVRLVFQPGEEIRAAGKDLIAKGALKNPDPDAVFALHAYPDLPLGALSSGPGPDHAGAAFFKIDVIGRGGHGSKPEETIDPILTAARLIEALQSIVSRTTSPLEPAVVSICRIAGGATGNVIPDRVELEGTARYYDLELGRQMPDMIRRIAQGVCDSMGASFEMDYDGTYIPTINDAGMVDLARKVTEKYLGPGTWVERTRPSMGGEDFAFYIVDHPGALVRLGMGPDCPPLHNSRFNFNDRALRNGILFHVGTALELLHG